MLIAISADSSVPRAKIQRLIETTGLSPCGDEQTDYRLHLSDTRLELHMHGMQPLYVDFTASKARHRRLHGGGKGQMLARAAGLRKHQKPEVIDATAGLGCDAFVLATLGANVTLLERSPIAHALLADGLRRARNEPEIATIASRMRLIHSDADDWLRVEQPRPDAIYLDPMFPTSGKTAQVKKEMQCFHALIGRDDDASRLLETARRLATRRVFVKRPRHAEALGGQTAAFSLRGKSTRFDVYLPTNPSALDSSIP